MSVWVQRMASGGDSGLGSGQWSRQWSLSGVSRGVASGKWGVQRVGHRASNSGASSFCLLSPASIGLRPSPGTHDFRDSACPGKGRPLWRSAAGLESNAARLAVIASHGKDLACRDVSSISSGHQETVDQIFRRLRQAAAPQSQRQPLPADGAVRPHRHDRRPDVERQRRRSTGRSRTATTSASRGRTQLFQGAMQLIATRIDQVDPERGRSRTISRRCRPSRSTSWWCGWARSSAA